VFIRSKTSFFNQINTINMKKNFLLLFVAVLSFAGLQSCNNGEKKEDAKKEADSTNKSLNVISPDDSKFMTEAASGGTMEVKAGQIALAKGTSKEVKDFGQQMVTDHSKANEELRELAKQKNVVLPDSVSNDDQKKLDKLNKESAKDFDKTYMDMMVDDHNKDVDAFQKVVDHPKDADVKAWAEKTLPTLKNHLQMAKLYKDAVHKAHK
jgi:putative membrane protein